LTQGHGNESIGLVKISGTAYFETSCLGSGDIAIGNLFSNGPCVGEVTVSTLPGYEGRRVAIDIHASSSTVWEIFIGELAR
jgi:hypothetical protein